MYVGCFFIKDCVEEFFFWCYWRFIFWCDFIDQNIVWFNVCIDVNDVCFVEVVQCFFIDVWNVVGDFFWVEFGVMGSDFEFFDVN